jgi:hypothetical protein
MNTTIPFYDIANKFLLGFIFVFVVFMLYANDILYFFIQNEKLFTIPAGIETILTICFLSAVYEIGVLLNRIASVGTEELLIKVKLWPPRSNYTNYNNAKRLHKKLPILAREYDFYKGHVTLFIILALLACVSFRWSLLIVFASIAIIFIASGKKQSHRINELVKDYENTTSIAHDLMA